MKRSRPAQESPAPAAKRVLIVDDHPFIRMGLTEALGREADLTVCGAAASAEEALTVAGTTRPDVVVTDLKLPGKSGLELIKDLAGLCPGLPVIVLSMHDEEIYAERCLRAGGRGYVMKDDGPECMVAAIRTVLAGGIHVSARASARIVEAFSGQQAREKRSTLGRLTDREFEIFQWIGRGLSTKEIAQRMHISAKTVETHRVHLKAKLGFATAAEVIVFAARWVESGR